MITRRTKAQLLVFVIITLLGVSYVGARYARLDRLFIDDSFTVVAHFRDSGGVFSGAEVDYRGVTVGQIHELEVTDDGVDAHLEIENKWDDIPADAMAVVANRSAVGEQYVDIQPKVDDGPYLDDDSEIAMEDTRIPISTSKLLTDLSNTASSVDQDSLRTTIHEFGTAFDGTGDDLGRIIDTSNEFIEAANDNFDTTTALIRDSNTVLKTQADSATAIRSFAKDLSLFSSSLAGSDQDLRAVIDNGSATANQLRTFLGDNRVELADLVNNLVTTGEIVVKRLPGVEQILVLYPYIVEGGFTVVGKDPATNLYDAHFGLVLTENPPVCHRGYESTDTRPPQDTADRGMNMSAHCAEPASQSNPRGAQHAPRAGAAYRAPVVAMYDTTTRDLRWTDSVPRHLSSSGSLASRALGGDSWKWLLLQPLVLQGE